MAQKKINLEKTEMQWDPTDPQVIESLKQMSPEELSGMGMTYWRDATAEGFTFSAPPLNLDAPVRIIRSPRADKTTITIEIDASTLDEPDKEKRKKLSEGILRVVKLHLKDELRLKHYKVGPAAEIAPGVTRRRMVLADRGLDLQTEEAIEAELQDFFRRRDAYRAELRAARIASTKERMLIELFPDNENQDEAWKRFRRKHKLSIKDLMGSDK